VDLEKGFAVSRESSSMRRGPDTLYEITVHVRIK